MVRRAREMLKRRKELLEKFKIPEEKAGKWLVLEKPPKNIEEYKAILKEVKIELNAVNQRLKRVKSETARRDLEEKRKLLEGVINRAEDKIAEYEKKELGKKLKGKAREEIKEEIREAKERVKKARKEERKKEAYEDLSGLLKKLREKGL